MKKIAIIYGGPGSEHEVSINSAKNILKNININKYEVINIFVSKNLEFNILDKNLIFSEENIFKYLLEIKINKVLPIFHGEYGEGGNFQKKLEENNLDFVGSGSISSHNAMDKNVSNKIFFENEILIPKSKIVNQNTILELNSFNFPLVIKPINEGSSIDLFKIENIQELENSIENVFKNHTEMLVQECIIGREFTCGVINCLEGNLFKNRALNPTEIILTKTKTFNYQAKYTTNGCSEITPANIDIELKNKIQNIALQCHSVLGCKDISRTDMIFGTNGNIYVLETNTIPGMTETSFIPAQLRSENIKMEDFIDILLG